jgi:hypothetical protein
MLVSGACTQGTQSAQYRSDTRPLSLLKALHRPHRLSAFDLLGQTLDAQSGDTWSTIAGHGRREADTNR